MVKGDFGFRFHGLWFMVQSDFGLMVNGSRFSELARVVLAEQQRTSRGRKRVIHNRLSWGRFRVYSLWIEILSQGRK